MNKAASPTELEKEIGLSLQTISDTLRNLRNTDIVRYETANKNKIYFLKDNGLTDIIKSIERFVQRTRIRQW